MNPNVSVASARGEATVEKVKERSVNYLGKKVHHTCSKGAGCLFSPAGDQRTENALQRLAQSRF